MPPDTAIQVSVPSDSGPSSDVCRPSSGSDWFSIWRAAAILDCTHRHARRELAGTDPSLIRYQHQGRGAPVKEYHCTCHPKLAAWAEARRQTTAGGEQIPQSQIENRKSKIPGVAPEDLALGELKAEAVRLYIELRDRLPESEAASQVCAAYLAAPKSRSIYIGERLAENNLRKHERTITLSTFSARTLREWYAAWSGQSRSRAGDGVARPSGSGPSSGVCRPSSGLMALVPDRKGNSGRKRGHKGEDIPEALLNIVWAWAIKNPRSDLRKGLVAAHAEWKGDWPDFHYRTWLRRLRARDPEKFTATIGKQGISAFRAQHTPDITRDYSAMAYNEEWQLDDVTQDFYGMDWSLQRLTRPFAYAIIRVATRQWIAVITTETPIVKDQVKSLVGLALADPIGGIPDRIRFERGTIACDEELERLLNSLGIKVCRTSMDGGKKHADAFADKGIGHFQGKGVIERAIRSLHNQPGLWDQPLQVGGMERTTASQNLETIKAMILAKAKEGQIIPRLAPAQWQAAVSGAMSLYNDTPHGSLPEIVDAETSAPDTIRYRHMSPNEYAVTIQNDTRVISEKILPLFFSRGTLVEVNKNGFTLNKFSYGRFDEDIQARAGTKVTAFQLSECPRVAYIAELGRCVEAWKMPKAGDEGDLVELKRGIGQTKRNKYEALMAEVLASGSQAVLDQTRLLANPLIVQPRKVEVIGNPALEAAAERQTAAIASFRDRQRTRDARFDLSVAALDERGSNPSDSDLSSVVRRPSSAAASRRGLLAREGDFSDQLAVLNTAEPLNKGGPLNF